ncbi:hypothetical protein ASF53_05200 [Methylobacterium sp. Leaf123]|uniref:hypothetical protein n=1 Tax=Methylobacterium sp. Leaf123 TaxID=1736264 RepID=UPI000701E0FD|nr:hypothetical protein [Methylobacterium sp. Leaf123]KQQ23721.1 hypothetical protein ASF53_05200 [Methylobacterium sp. Leaf123]
MSEPSKPQSDLLYGVPAIAAFLRMRERQCRHRIDTGLIPAFRLEGTICSRESTLNVWLAEREAAGREDKANG